MQINVSDNFTGSNPLGTIPGMAAIRPRLLQYSYQVPLLVLPCYDHCDVRKYHPFYSQ